VKIGEHDLNKRVFIIAEIGNNHEGDLEVAIRMLHSAAEAGADAVKFQAIDPEEMVSSDQRERIAQLKRFRFSRADFELLAQEARSAGKVFLATAFDLKSADFLNGLVPAFKVASCDIDHVPLLERIASFGKPVLLSAGTAMDDELRSARTAVEAVWKKGGVSPGLAFLHCVSKYPTPDDEADLSRIIAIKAMGVVPGYSDHTLGIDATVAAVALGARVIEKHFTIDKDFSDFRDHKISADPAEFRYMVERIRQVEKFMRPLAGKYGRANFSAIRRSVAAGRDMLAGETLKMEDFSWVRPGTGLPPGETKALIGKKLLRPLKRGELILKEYVEG
jgi:N-acetylneuraminate synthase/N,N'-diacetyllegionaminate synthase